MDKVIIHPGNGITIPKQGDYIKLNMQLTDESGLIWFDSALTKNKYTEIRFKTREGNMFEQLEEIIGEMSWFEKCSLELSKSIEHEINSKQIKMLLNQYDKIIINLEIVSISSVTHFS